MTDVLACVAGARKGRGRELGRETTREGEGRREEGERGTFSLVRAKKIPPSPFNACHVDY